MDHAMTWSILARDARTGEVGAAVATRFFAAGALCLRAEGRVGAVATQALVNPMLAPAALDLIRAGAAPEAAVRTVVDADPGRRARQLHVLRADGASFRHTGEECVEWAGHVDGPDVSVAGNMLAGAGVVEATRDAFLAGAGMPMAERLIAALEAGEAMGGDKRGKQAAALVVVSEDPYPDLDLRVDDHPDPLAELRRLHGVARTHFVHFRRFLAGRDHPGVFDRAAINAAIARATAGEPAKA
jgi:uncharacterized Ntn-hydrolase superfamily protein